MGQRIKRVHVTDVFRGMYIVQEDAEELTDEQINEDWDADEQDWQHVIRARHFADISNLTLAYYNGETHKASGTGYVWALVDERGEFVEMDPAERDDLDV